MIALDTNILVYAHRQDSPWHAQASVAVSELAAARSLWAIAWPCLHEFIAITTHPRIYSPPSTLDEACDQIEAWRESPTLILLSETDDYWPTIKRLVSRALIVGPAVHDARIAALCLYHGVTELWSADRDFSRFPDLRVRNPLVQPASR